MSVAPAHQQPETPSGPVATPALHLAAALDLHGEVLVTGEGPLDALFPVSSFAAAAVATTGLAIADLVGADGPVTVDARLASAWFASAVRPHAPLPSPWDDLAGDYRAVDQWIRLHTNAPAHRAAALEVLGLTAEADHDTVACAVAGWAATDLEEEVIAAGGCAAVLRSFAEWDAHPQGQAVAAEPLIARELGEQGRPLPAGFPDRPLGGVRVLDLTRVLAGPVATRVLALLGAEVLRIDPPDWAEPALEPDMTLGKRSARLDGHALEGASELAALLAEADVLVHGLRPGALDSLGVDAATRRELRPGLVEVQLDAWGYSGPWAGRRGFDSLVQVATGFADRGMRATGSERPVPLPVQALDHATGWLAATAALQGIALARQSGVGSRSRVSLARTALELRAMADAHPAPSPQLASPAPSAPPAVAAGAAPDPGPVAEAAAELPSTLLSTPWGEADLLEPPVTVEGVRLHTYLAPRPLGSDEARWLLDNDEDAPQARRPRGPGAVVLQPGRVTLWAVLSGLLVWAGQGLPFTLGQLLLGQQLRGFDWWTDPAWAAGAAAQAATLALVWWATARWWPIGAVLALALPLAVVANVGAAVATATALASVSTEILVTDLGTALTVYFVTGAGVVALLVPGGLLLSRYFAGATSLGRSAIAPRYARG